MTPAITAALQAFVRASHPEADAATVQAVADSIDVQQASIALHEAIDAIAMAPSPEPQDELPTPPSEITVPSIEAADLPETGPPAEPVMPIFPRSNPTHDNPNAAAAPTSGAVDDVAAQPANSTIDPALAVDAESAQSAMEPPKADVAIDTTAVVPAASPQAVAAAPAKAPIALPAGPVLTFTLRNLRQGEAAESLLSTAPHGLDCDFIDVTLPPDLGLQWNADSQVVHGTPALSGEFKIHITYRSRANTAEQRAVVSLLVNPDPKLLWKDLVTDPDAPFQKPNAAQQHIDGSGRRLVAARQRGRSHAHVGSFCDDDFLIDHLPNGWFISIVADGAGSAKYSRHGSALACKAAGDFLRAELAGDAGDAVVRAARGLAAASPETHASAKGKLQNALYTTVGYAAHKSMKAHDDELRKQGEVTSLRDMATTLLIGIARELDGKLLCAAYWVGDGAVGVYRAGESVHVLGDVDSGEYSGQTRFLAPEEVDQESLLRRIRFELVDDFTAFILMSDGVSDAKFETEARLERVNAWDALWADLEAGAKLSSRDDGIDQRLQDWLGFWSPGNHDDRTISILY